LPNDTIAKINNTVSSKFLKTYRGDSDVRSLKAKTDDMKSGEVKRLQKEKASYLNKINQLQSEIDILRREVDTRAEESHRWIDVVERLEATNIRLAQEVTRYISEADKIERDAVKDKNEMASRIMASQSKIEEGIIDETNLRSLFNELASLIRSCVNSTIFHLNGKIDDFKSRFGEEYGVKMMGILFAVITDKVGNLFTFMAAKWSHHPDKTLHYIAIDRKIVDIIYTIRHLAPESRTRIWLLSSKKELGNDDISDIGKLSLCIYCMI
jgi:vacuolar-type H+-ATPase subunit I/STV1